MITCRTWITFLCYFPTLKFSFQPILQISESRKKQPKNYLSKEHKNGNSVYVAGLFVDVPLFKI